MRVVAGSAGGIPLESPGARLRPTMDRVKEAIFSSLGERVPGARVLDLFAGSGALGIEALSRGAVSALFVDADAKSAACIQRNLAKTNLQAAVKRMDVFDFVKRAGSGEVYDLVFADPPYAREAGERDFAGELLESSLLPALLAPDGLLVVERAAPSPPPNFGAWRLLKTRRYASTEVLYLERAAGEGEVP